MILATGLSLTYRQGVLLLAQTLSEHGLAALCFDHPNFGESDGEPRAHCEWWTQLDGIRGALAYLASLDGIDAARLGVWGFSFAGTHALALGAIDPRVACIVAVAPGRLGRIPAMSKRDTHFALLRAATEAEATAADDDEDELLQMGPMPVVSHDAHETSWFGDFIGGHADAVDFLLGPETEARATGWTNYASMGETRSQIPGPGAAVPFVRVPTMVAGAVDDRTVSFGTCRAVHASLPSGLPSALLPMSGGHFGILYEHGERGKSAASARRAMAEFFVDALLDRRHGHDRNATLTASARKPADAALGKHMQESVQQTV